MTPAEAAAFLRNYNVWRRGNLDDQPMPDPREIGKAIDAAIEMIGRLEATEKAWKINDQTIYDLTEKVIPNTQEKLEAAEKENKVLREALAEKVTSETMLRDLSVGNGSVNASFEGGALHLLVDAFADQFSESGAENYLEMQFHSPATGPLVATLQRVNGKTPHQLREAAEKERDDVAQQLVQSEIGKREISEAHNAVTRRLSVLADENTALRAKVADMERQEPVEWQSRTRPVWNDGMWTQWSKCSEGYAKDIMTASLVNDWIYEARPLYAIPVVQAAPSVPDGWLRAIDEALVVAHIGVANAEDTYEQAKAKLDNLIGFHVDVATDPVVNGGYKLMPVEPTKEIYECFAAYDGTTYSNPFDFNDFREDYLAAINSTGLPVGAKLYALPGAKGEEK